VTLPGNYTVTARLIVPDGSSKPNYAYVHTPRPEPPADIAKDPAALSKWYAQPEVRAAMQKDCIYMMRQTPEGAWLAEGYNFQNPGPAKTQTIVQIKSGRGVSAIAAALKSICSPAFMTR